MVFATPAQSPAEQYILSTCLTAITTLLVTLRLYAIKKQKVGFGQDDWWILFALIATWATSITNIVGTAIGNEARHLQLTPEGEPVNLPQFQRFLHVLFVNQLTQVLAVGPTKISVLLFYRRVFVGRIFRGWTLVNVVTWTLIVLAGVWTVAFFLANLLGCIPISVNWIVGSGPSGRCTNVIAIYLSQAWTDVFLDVSILLVPIPCVWRLQLSVARRCAILGLFFVGVLTIAASVTKLVIQMFVGTEADQELDITYQLAPIMYWPMIEACLGVIAACLPRMGLFHQAIAESKGFFLSIRSTFSDGSLSHLRLFKSRTHVSKSISAESQERDASVQSQGAQESDGPLTNIDMSFDEKAFSSDNRTTTTGQLGTEV